MAAPVNDTGDTTTKGATVLTPHGLFPASNVHRVPKGGWIEHVGDEVHLFDADGKVIHIAQNDGSKVRKRPTPATSSGETFADGWVAQVSWCNTGKSPISSFTTTWTVPPIPKTYHGQTIIFFNGLMPRRENTVLQPCLQYGPSKEGGSSFWGLVSCYVTNHQNYYSEPFIQTFPGTVVTGRITLNHGQVGSKFHYSCSFDGLPDTTLNIRSSEQFVWAVEALESFSIRAITDYPPVPTVYSNINLQTTSGTPAVTWDNTYDDEYEGITAIINKQGAVDAEVTISYSN